MALFFIGNNALLIFLSTGPILVPLPAVKMQTFMNHVSKTLQLS
jgi:hypothetical protein